MICDWRAHHTHSMRLFIRFVDVVVVLNVWFDFVFSFLSHRAGCISHDQTEKNHNLHRCQGNDDSKGAEANDWGYIESTASRSMLIQQRKRSDVRRKAITRLWNCGVDGQSTITATIRSSSEVISQFIHICSVYVLNSNFYSIQFSSHFSLVTQVR